MLGRWDVMAADGESVARGFAPERPPLGPVLVPPRATRATGWKRVCSYTCMCVLVLVHGSIVINHTSCFDGGVGAVLVMST